MDHPATFDAAPQHGPRPLPLFLDLLRSETAASSERRTAALAGLKAYQDAPRSAHPAFPPEVARVGRACLRDYGGDGPPVVFVPSLVNPPFVLDLAPHNSLLRWMALQGVRPLLLDWGTPDEHERDLDIGGHVDALLLPLLDAIDARTALVGYCLGGTMAIAAASLRDVAGLALIATPWHFSGFLDGARADIAALWASAAPLCQELGYLPVEVLQSAFWRLDPARTIGKFERFATLDPSSEEARTFVALEDWANGGAPLTFAAGRQALADFFADDTPGRGTWRVAGKAIDPARLRCPIVDIISLNDRIVPAATASRQANTLSLNAGHVGMVVGRRARSQLWEPLRDWLLQLR